MKIKATTYNQPIFQGKKRSKITTIEQLNGYKIKAEKVKIIRETFTKGGLTTSLLSLGFSSKPNLSMAVFFLGELSVIAGIFCNIVHIRMKEVIKAAQKVIKK